MTKEAKNQVSILGSGTSTGVPMPGCSCAVCLSPDPRNKRMRTSVFLHTSQGKKILIDTTPDLRMQLLNHSIKEVDAVVITHDHADHVHGIDDLRPLAYFRPTPIPIYTNANTAKSLIMRFPYIFRAHEIFTADRPIIGGGVPKVDLRTFSVQDGPLTMAGEEFHFFELPHGYVQTLCFTHGKFGYIVDCQEIPASVIEHFKKQRLEFLVIDCLQREKKKTLTHLTLEETLSCVKEIDPLQAGLIHLSHFMEHQHLESELKARGLHHIFPLYDGQVFTYGASDE